MFDSLFSHIINILSGSLRRSRGALPLLVSWKSVMWAHFKSGGVLVTVLLPYPMLQNQMKVQHTHNGKLMNQIETKNGEQRDRILNKVQQTKYPVEKKQLKERWQKLRSKEGSTASEESRLLCCRRSVLTGLYSRIISKTARMSFPVGWSFCHLRYSFMPLRYFWHQAERHNQQESVPLG